MTEHQANSPIDELFRKTFENQPDTPSESGWDTPSDRVWQQVQANMPQAQHTGWSMSSILLLSVLTVALLAGLYWWTIRPVQKPTTLPAAPPSIEQPAATPSTPANTPTENQTIVPVKSDKDHNTVKPNTGNSQQPAVEKPAKPTVPSAQPLPGSKNTLPPNSTEAKKKQGEQ